MEDIFTLQGALQYGYEGRIEEWVHSFLIGAGHNPFLSYVMKMKKRYFSEPLIFPLDTFKRNCGPEENMKYKVKQPGFEFMVGTMMASFINGWDMPPLIIEYRNGSFDLSDGNHRYEALTRLGVTHYYVIFWTSSEEDYEELIELISNKTDEEEITDENTDD